MNEKDKEFFGGLQKQLDDMYKRAAAMGKPMDPSIILLIQTTATIRLAHEAVRIADALELAAKNPLYVINTGAGASQDG